MKTKTKKTKTKAKPKEPTYFQKLVLLDERFIHWLRNCFGGMGNSYKELKDSPFVLVGHGHGLANSAKGFKSEADAYEFLRGLRWFDLRDYNNALLFNVKRGTRKTIKVNVTTTAMVS